MSFFKEFKEFINQGDVMDMAVGIIIGGALTAIVTALTSDIIQPLINFVTAGTPRSGDWSFRERESTSGRSSAPASTSSSSRSSCSASSRASTR